MRLLRRSPILRSMLFLNFILVMALLFPFYWPMPDSATEELNAKTSDYEDLVGLNRVTDPVPAKERPIFHENRRPAQPAPSQQQAAPKRAAKAFNLRLKGIVQARDGQWIAYLQNTDTNETFSARVADSTAGWTIDAVTADNITLVNGQRRKVLNLNEGG